MRSDFLRWGLLAAIIVSGLLIVCGAAPVVALGAQAYPTAQPGVAALPIALQTCAQDPKTKHTTDTMAAGSLDAKVDFDVLFVNTARKTATAIILRIGQTNYANMGTFLPGVAVSWRLTAVPGPCEILAVQYKDGSEWIAPSPSPSP